MRIRTLTLKNFRSHEETVLDLDRFNFVRGPNGCGKSSIQMALEYLLTGRCEMTDAAGRGAEALIRTGAKELAVSATLDGGETICRRRTARSHILELNGNRVPVEVAEDSFEKRFGPTDVLSAVLNAGRFIEVSESEQKRLLAQVVEAGRVDLPGEIVEAIKAINEEPPKLASVGDIEAAYKRFYDLRTEAGRALKGLGKMEKPDIPAELPNVQDVKKKLEELRLQKESLIAQKAGEVASRESAQARLKRIRAEIEEVAAEILTPSQEQELSQLASQQAQTDTLRQELANLVAEQNGAETSLAALQELKGRCPRCRQPISEEAKNKEMRALRDRLADLDAMIQGSKEELKECAEVATAFSRLEQHRKAVARRSKLMEEESRLRAVEKPGTGDFDGRLTILVERIRKGERVLEKAQQLHSVQERWEAHVRENSILDSRIGVLDKLIDFFGPNGTLMGRAGGRMQSFSEDLNRHLEAFGYACNLVLEPFEIGIVSKTSDCSLPLKQLSESERFRFAVAFQIALATVTGVRFVVIDRADVLDRERRRMLTNLLVKSDLDQAIVLATSEEAEPAIVPEGVKFLSLVTPVIPHEPVVSTAA